MTGRLKAMRWGRLGSLLALAVLFAVMTGPQGSGDDYFYSLRHSLGDGVRLPVLVVIAVAVWLAGELGRPWWERGRVWWESVQPSVVRAREVRDRARGTRWVRFGGPVAVLAFLAVLPFFLATFWTQVLVDEMGVYVLLAVGLNVVVGWAGLLDLGFIAFFAIGAYTSAYWTGAMPDKPPVRLTAFEAVPMVVATCLVAGVLLGAPTLRLRGDYLAIVTLGFHEIIFIIARNVRSFTNGPSGVQRPGRFSVDLGFWHYRWGLDPRPYWWLILAIVTLLAVAFLRLEHSRVGRAWTAIREDETAAAASGVATVKYKLMAFAIGASTAGIAGAVYAGKSASFAPDSFLLQFSILVLAYVIFGGMGSIWGVIVGTAFLAWLPEYLKDWVTSEDRYMYLGALLVVMMIYRPQGLIPSARRRRELTLAREGVGGADAMSAPAGGRAA